MTGRTCTTEGGILAAAILLAGCTPGVGIPGTGGPGGRQPIGVLGVSGPNVFVNRALASSGTTIFSRDDVSTGPDSSAIVQFNMGGSYQIDENTDPRFTEIFKNVRCILVDIFYGQSFGEDAHICIKSPAADAVVGSTVNIRVSPNESSLTLLQGTLTVERPQRVSLASGQEATATVGVSNVQVRNLSAAELQRVVAWRTRFRFRGWCYEAGSARETFQDECGPGEFSFKSPAPPPPVYQPRPTYPSPLYPPRSWPQPSYQPPIRTPYQPPPYQPPIGTPYRPPYQPPIRTPYQPPYQQPLH